MACGTVKGKKTGKKIGKKAAKKRYETMAHRLRRLELRPNRVL